MYIISKRKDYYDGVVGSVGIDKKIVYNRNLIEITDMCLFPKEFKTDQRNNPFTNIRYGRINTKNNVKYINYNLFIVGFCGKLYLGWKFYYKDKTITDSGVSIDVIKTDIIYGYDNVKNIINRSYQIVKFITDIKYVLSYDPINIFRELNAPVFIFEMNNIKDDIIYVNPILNDYEFYKIFDTFSAFQEIEMFLVGVLGSIEKEIIEIDDKYKIEQHGFDKWSFRKEPEK